MIEIKRVDDEEDEEDEDDDDFEEEDEFEDEDDVIQVSEGVCPHCKKAFHIIIEPAGHE